MNAKDVVLVVALTLLATAALIGLKTVYDESRLNGTITYSSESG